MKKIIGVGDTDVDLYVKVPYIAGNDEKVLGEFLGEFPGGMIGNFCSAVAKYGHSNVEIVTALGKDRYGSIALKAFVDLGIQIDGIQVHPSERTYFCVVMIDESGEKALTIVPTKVMYPDPGLINKKILDTADYIHSTGGNQALLAFLCQNKGEKAVLSIDLEITMLEQFMKNRHLIHKVDILFTNKQTVVQLFQNDEIETNIKKLGEIGFSTAVVTAGIAGSYVYVRDKEFFHHQPAFIVKPVDTTGAGDCYSAIFISALASGESVENAMKYASAGAAISIKSLGARMGQPTKAEVKGFIKKYKGTLVKASN